MLSVRDLSTEFGKPPQAVRAVDGVSFDVADGRVTALVGESGSGKSMTALSILRLLPAAARAAGGEARLDGDDLLALSDAQMRGVRGARIGMIFQEPMSALNPVLTIGRQVAEPIEQHLRLPRREAQRRAVEALAAAALPDPVRAAAAYPHQLSGGQRQRAMIAVALAAGPKLLIADEPTTALDVTVQGEILALLRRLAAERGLGVLLITHDLGVVAAASQDVVVMYAARVVERGPTAEVLRRPRHPYTRGLLECAPSIVGPRGRLAVIPGAAPELGAWPSGCRFHPRCGLGADDAKCRSESPPLEGLSTGRWSACWKAAQL